MQYIVDILLVALFAFTVYRASKKGFFLTLFELGAYVISLIISKMLSGAVAPQVYANMFEKPLFTRVENALGSLGQVDVAAKINGAFEAIPVQFNGVLELIGINKQAMIDSVSANELAGKNIVENIMDKIVSPVTTAIVQTLLFIVFSIIVIIILRFVIRIMNTTIKKIPVIKQVNSSLGAVIGIVKGLIVVVIVALALGAFSGVFGNDRIVELVNDSVIVKSTGEMLDSISGFKF